MLYINIDTLVDRAIAVTKWNIATGIDKRGIEAIGNRNSSGLTRWLRDYAAVRGLTKVEVNNIVHAVFAFAEREGCHLDNIGISELIHKYHLLQGDCKEAIRRSAGRERNVRSLTTKALWCCYPNAVPIYDGLAQNALWIISKLDDKRPDPRYAGDVYAEFVDIWMQFFREAETIVSAAAEQINSPYAFKIRIFDRMLWILGQPNYTGETTIDASGKPAAATRQPI